MSVHREEMPEDAGFDPNTDPNADNHRGSHPSRGVYPETETGTDARPGTGPLADIDIENDPSLRDRDLTDASLETGGLGDDARGGRSTALGSDPTRPPVGAEEIGGLGADPELRPSGER